MFFSDTNIYRHIFHSIGDEWAVGEWENEGACMTEDSGLSCGLGFQNQTRTCTSTSAETPCVPGFGVTWRTISCSDAGTFPLCSGK